MINVVRRVDWESRLNAMDGDQKSGDTQSTELSSPQTTSTKSNGKKPKTSSKSKRTPKTKEQLDAERKEREIERAQRDSETAKQRLSLRLQKSTESSLVASGQWKINKRPKDDVSDVEM